MSRDRTTSGYIGLIVLLVSFAVIGLLFMALYMTPDEHPAPLPDDALQPLTASGTVPTTAYERYQADVDAAHRAGDLIEQRSNGYDELPLE